MYAVRRLSKIYDMGNVQVRALDDISFDVADGDMLIITGKSGSGKSTLLRQMGLLDKPTSGQIIVEGEDVTSFPESVKSKLRLRQMGYVFQEYALLMELTALQNVFLPGMMLGSNGINYRYQARELLEMVGLGNRLKHFPKELSGGEQQRVAIARALINKPRVLLADEPCANLDTVSSEMIMETLVRLNRDLGVTIVFVSHDQDDKKYAKHNLILRDGKIAEGNGWPT